MSEDQVDTATGRKRVGAICRRLGKAYGTVEAPRPRPVLDSLVGTVLSQNTSDRNSHAAFEELVRRFDDWDAVRRAPAARIARAIRRAGLSNQKAPRIKTILNRIRDDRGGNTEDGQRAKCQIGCGELAPLRWWTVARAFP